MLKGLIEWNEDAAAAVWASTTFHQQLPAHSDARKEASARNKVTRALGVGGWVGGRHMGGGTSPRAQARAARERAAQPPKISSKTEKKRF